MDNAALTFTPLSPVIGMEVRGVDLARPLPPETTERLTEELSRRSILLFRGQALTAEQHIACSRYFGKLEPHVADQFNLPDHPEIFVVSNVVENGREIGARGGAKHWHSDYSYRERPSLGSLFYCLEAPPEGAALAEEAAFEVEPAAPAAPEPTPDEEPDEDLLARIRDI